MAGHDLTTDERVAIAETNIETIGRAILATDANVKELTNALSTLGKELTSVTVILKNPSREHCILMDDFREWRTLYIEDMRKLREAHEREMHEMREEQSKARASLYEKIDTHRVELDSLKSRADRFEGGIRVVVALIGGGNIITITTIIGGIIWMARHWPK